MTDLENYVMKQIAQLISDYDEIEVCGWVADDSYSLEFYVTKDEERLQCYELSDNGIFEEYQADVVIKEIAHYIRTTMNYQKGELNQIKIKVGKQQ